MKGLLLLLFLLLLLLLLKNWLKVTLSQL